MGAKLIAYQDVVDAQALVLPEREIAIVPPAPTACRLLKEPKCVVQAQSYETTKVRSFLWRAMDLPCPCHRVKYVSILRSDVEIAHKCQSWMQ